MNHSLECNQSSQCTQCLPSAKIISKQWDGRFIGDLTISICCKNCDFSISYPNKSRMYVKHQLERIIKIPYTSEAKCFHEFIIEEGVIQNNET